MAKTKWVDGSTQGLPGACICPICGYYFIGCPGKGELMSFYKFCPNCGENMELMSFYKFCPNCGENMELISKEEKEK